MRLADLQREAWKTAEDHGFHATPATFGDRIALIHSELSEALEEFREGRMRVWFRWDGKPEGVPVELADALIRILDLAAVDGIDLEKVVRLKMDFNKGRPHLHGGKAI